MSHEGANVMALVDSCKNVVYHSQNVKELRGLNVISNRCKASTESQSEMREKSAASTRRGWRFRDR